MKFLSKYTKSFIREIPFQNGVWKMVSIWVGPEYVKTADLGQFSIDAWARSRSIREDVTYLIAAPTGLDLAQPEIENGPWDEYRSHSPFCSSHGVLLRENLIQIVLYVWKLIHQGCANASLNGGFDVADRGDILFFVKPGKIESFTKNITVMTHCSLLVVTPYGATGMNNDLLPYCKFCHQANIQTCRFG